jgi:hypothetical protein
VQALLDLHSHKTETFHEIGEERGVRLWVDEFFPHLEENCGDMEEVLPAATLRKLDRVLPLAESTLWDRGEPTLIHNDV